MHGKTAQIVAAKQQIVLFCGRCLVDCLVDCLADCLQKHVRRYVEALRQGADLAQVQLAFTVQNT